MVKMNYERHILALAQHLVQKAIAGMALLFQHAPLAHARIHQKAKGKGQIRIMGEVADCLRTPIFFQHKIVFCQIADDLPRLSRTVAGTLTTFTVTLSVEGCFVSADVRAVEAAAGRSEERHQQTG